MRPEQCGTGRRGFMTPGDRAAIEAFGHWLQTGGTHIRLVRQLMHDGAPLQLEAGAPFHVDDFVKVADETSPHLGRWGIVTAVEHYRGRYVHPDDGQQFLVMVMLKTTMPGVGIVNQPPGPVPFEPWELEPLFGIKGGSGDWVRRGRVVSPANWPTARDGVSEAS